MNEPAVTKSSASAQPASILDLIDDALSVVSAQQVKRLANLLDETHRLFVQTMDAQTRPGIDALRAASQRLGEACSYLGFHAGADFAYAVETLTARLLVNARCAPSEWRRALAMEEHAFALLGPRRLPAQNK